MTFLRNSNIAQAWLVLIFATVFGTALAGIQVKLGPVIEANKIRETMEKIPDLVLDSSADTRKAAHDLSIQSRVIEIKKNGITKFYPVYDAYFKNGSPAGHVIKASGQGYADKIELLVALDANGKTITGLFILDQKETPGLGNRILETSWRNQFVKKSTDIPLTVVKGGSQKPHEIDGLSGATISSRTVTHIVNMTISDVRSRLNPSLEKETGMQKGVKKEETD